MGAGPFAKNLSYKDWSEFNVYQRIHNNSIDHLSGLMPLTLVAGVFFPRFTVSCIGTIIVGRELYRYGYLTKEGPNSLIRELGAYPLNIAEIFLIMSLGLVYLKYKTGAFFLRRRIVRYFTGWTKLDWQAEKL